MDLSKELSLDKVQKEDIDQYKFLVNNLLESHVPMEENYIGRNQSPFMNKSIRKAITARTRLLHNCGKLFKNTNSNFYKKLIVNRITDNKSLWKTVKSSFTENTLKDKNIILVENVKTILEEIEVVKIFRSDFDGTDVTRSRKKI